MQQCRDASRLLSALQGQDTHAIEVFHVRRSRGLEVDEERGLAPDAVEVCFSILPFSGLPSNVRSRPGTRPAMASRCTTAFVLPPIACSTVIAFSKLALVSTSLGRGMPVAASLPVSSATRRRWLPFAGGHADPSGAIPSASVMHAMVDAVPITPHVYCQPIIL